MTFRVCHGIAVPQGKMCHMRFTNAPRLKVVVKPDSNPSSLLAAVRQIIVWGISGRPIWAGAIGLRMADKLTDEERTAFETEIERLRQEHRDLDAAIEALMLLGQPDQLQLQRFKKRKLALRDRITFLDDQLTPDIIA